MRWGRGAGQGGGGGQDEVGDKGRTRREGRKGKHRTMEGWQWLTVRQRWGEDWVT